MTRAYARTSVSPSSLTRSSLGLVAILTEATVLYLEFHVYLVLVLDVDVTYTATEVKSRPAWFLFFFFASLRYDRGNRGVVRSFGKIYLRGWMSAGSKNRMILGGSLGGILAVLLFVLVEISWTRAKPQQIKPGECFPFLFFLLPTNYSYPPRTR